MVHQQRTILKKNHQSINPAQMGAIVFTLDLVTLNSWLADIIRYVMELLVVRAEEPTWTQNLIYSDRTKKESAVDCCRPLTSPQSTARRDPVPSVFRQETGMQKGGEDTKSKGRKETRVR